MKKRIPFALLALLTLISCNDELSYSNLQDKEVETIEEYIESENIKVVTTLPTDKEWTEKTYFKSSSGLYYHLVEKGNSTYQAKTNSIVSFRYILSKIDKKRTILLRNWDAQDFTHPQKIKLKNLTYNRNFGAGVHEAIGYMKNYYSEAIIIVPSGINTDLYKDAVTPVKYRIKITDIR